LKSLFLISLLILFFIDDFQAQIKFQKTYGAANNEYAHDVKQTSDGGYIFVDTHTALEQVSRMFISLKQMNMVMFSGQKLMAGQLPISDFQ